MGVDSAVCRLNHDLWVVFRRVVQNGCGRLPHFPQVTCILFRRFFHLGLVGFSDFRETGSDEVDQGPDTRRSSFFSMQPWFRWAQSERIHFSLADATAFFISRRVVLRVRIRDRREGLEVCAANAVFRFFDERF